MTKGPAAVLAVDGGNSKAELALVDATGRLLSAVRGATISHQAVGLEAGMDNLRALAAKAAAGAGRPRPGEPRGHAKRAPEPLAELGRYDSAGTEYRAALRLEPKLTAAAVYLAALLRAQGRLRDAIAQLDSALSPRLWKQSHFR